MTDAEIVQVIAEKVMGWHEQTFPKSIMPSWKGWADDKNVCQAWAEDDPGYDIGDEAWNPLTSDADACAVLDRMMELGWPYALGNNCVVKGHEHYCHFWLNKEFKSVKVHADSRQRAICLAALKAVGVKVE